MSSLSSAGGFGKTLPSCDMPLQRPHRAAVVWVVVWQVCDLPQDAAVVIKLAQRCGRGGGGRVGGMRELSEGVLDFADAALPLVVVTGFA